MPILKLQVATGDPLSVCRFAVVEAVSEPFDITVVARTEDPSLDLDAIVGRRATFQIDPGGAGAPHHARRWTGICRVAEQEQAEPSGLSTYRFRLAPALWLMTQRRDHRIFQHRTAPDLAADLLDLWGLERALVLDARTYLPLPYKVQYAESDYAFFCRLLEEAGIAFTFPGGEVVELGNRLHAGPPRPSIAHVQSPSPSGEQDFVTDVHLADRSRPGAYALRDHDLRRPGYRLLAEAARALGPEAAHEQYHYRPGGFLVDTSAASGDTPVADAEGAGRHDLDEGRRRAARALASERADKQVVAYRTNVLDLWPGRVFSIADHPHPLLCEARRLLVTALSLDGAPGEPWTFLGRAVFADTEYRPPLRTSRPRARIQSATVVGGEEVDADELGRVRVRFPWDRRLGGATWIRVSETWAGAGYGMITLPRAGQEVLVDFLEGDPEQPVVVGRVFNQTNPVVERLPEHDTRSAWKSDSSPGSSGFNELLLEDRKGSELLYAQAQKDARRLVKHDDTSTVVHNRQKLVQVNELETTGGDRVQETKGDRVELTYGDQTMAIDGTRRDRVSHEAVERVEGEQVARVGSDQHLVTAGEKRELVEYDTHLRIGRSRPERVGGTDSLVVGKATNEQVGSYSVDASGPRGWIHIIAGSKIVIESDTDVTVKAGGNYVEIAGDATIFGAEVFINDGGSSAGSLPGPGSPRPATPRIAMVDEPAPPVVREVTGVDEMAAAEE